MNPIRAVTKHSSTNFNRRQLHSEVPLREPKWVQNKPQNRSQLHQILCNFIDEARQCCLQSSSPFHNIVPIKTPCSYCKLDNLECHSPVSQCVLWLSTARVIFIQQRPGGAQTNVPLTLQKERGFVIQTIITWIFDYNIKGLCCKLAWPCIQRGDLSLCTTAGQTILDQQKTNVFFGAHLIFTMLLLNLTIHTHYVCVEPWNLCKNTTPDGSVAA